MADVQEYELYEGKVKVRFFPDSHQYWVNEKRKTGVTTYLGIIDKSRPLIIWATGLYRDFLMEQLPNGITAEHIIEGYTIHTRRKEEAASIGDDVHKWIESHIKNESPEMPERREAQIGINAFLDWVNENKVKFISSERVVYSKKYDYIGKMDIEANVNGKLCLIDIKTANNLYNTYNLQIAAYLKADEEESTRRYQGRWLIRLAKETEDEYKKRMIDKGKDGSGYKVFEAKFLDDEMMNIERDFKAFLHAKALYEWNRENEHWNDI